MSNTRLCLVWSIQSLRLMCSFLCVPFVLTSHCSHTPCFPCVAAFMKAIRREHWEQTCCFSSVAVSSTFALVPIMGGGAVAFQIAELTKKWAELTCAELIKKHGPNWPKSGPNWPESRPNWPGPNWPCGPNWPGLNWNWPELTRCPQA